jgi:prevent-host-death family protein
MVNEMGIAELRAQLADVLNRTTVRGDITYVTSRGRRIAALVSVADAELLERLRQEEAGQGAPGT